jgi:hypothetical protein
MRPRAASVQPFRMNSDDQVADHFVGSDQLVEIGKGGLRVADHFGEVTDMIELGKSGKRVENHFVDVTDMVEVGSGAQRARKTVMMSRHLCELVIQNADPAPASLSP